MGSVQQLIVGVMHIWHTKWLKFSPSNTPPGKRLYQLCVLHQLFKCVKTPTREENLLDLCLASSPDLVKTRVLPKIADHQGILVAVIVHTLI